MYPAHWGKVPEIQTSDIVQLPGAYGMGSSTLKAWILSNMRNDKNPAPFRLSYSSLPGHY